MTPSAVIIDSDGRYLTKGEKISAAADLKRLRKSIALDAYFRGEPVDVAIFDEPHGQTGHVPTREEIEEAKAALKAEHLAAMQASKNGVQFGAHRRNGKNPRVGHEGTPGGIKVCRVHGRGR